MPPARPIDDYEATDYESHSWFGGQPVDQIRNLEAIDAVHWLSLLLLISLAIYLPESWPVRPYIRATAKWAALLLPCTLIVTFMARGQVASANGYLSPDDWRLAIKQGVTDASEWRQSVEDQRRSTEAIAALQAAKKQAECRSSAACFVEASYSLAEAQCVKEIEESATYGLRWENQFFQRKFSAATWVNEQDGVVKLGGDRLRMENEYGAWGRAVYWCSYSVSANAVLDSGARVRR